MHSNYVAKYYEFPILPLRYMNFYYLTVTELLIPITSPLETLISITSLKQIEWIPKGCLIMHSNYVAKYYEFLLLPLRYMNSYYLTVTELSIPITSPLETLISITSLKQIYSSPTLHQSSTNNHL